MGKLNKRISKKKDNATYRASLSDQILNETKTKDRQSFKIKSERLKYIDSKLSSKIISQAKEQLKEFTDCTESAKPCPNPNSGNILNEELQLAIEKYEDGINESSELYYEDTEISKDDELAFEKFMNSDNEIRHSMADLISERLTEKKTELNSQILGDLEINPITKLDPKVVELYKGVGKILSQYRSGKMPKAFKIIPALADWESILQLTAPDKWSSAAMYQATRLFASNLKANLAQRFYNKILLPRVRDDIAEFKKLNFHLYQALYKSMFKPAAFFKGILIPLLEPQPMPCTLREAFIVAGVIHKNSLPLLHSCAAILKLLELAEGSTYSGPISIFLRVLLSKNYALPTRVMDTLISYFTGFASCKETLPVLWHQSTLAFVQNYKLQMSVEAKESLKELIKRQAHEKMSPVILEELNSTELSDKKNFDTLEQDLQQDVIME